MRAVLSTLWILPAALLALAVALPVAAVGLPFWLVAGLTRALARATRKLRPRPVPWEELVQFEPTIGWRPKPGLDAHASSDRVFHLTTDEEGWRGRVRLDRADVVALGDSFAFGTGIDDPDFFADQPVGTSIKAVGGNGYSMVQEMLWLERLRGRLAGKLVVWLVYYGNDLVDNLRPNLGRYRMPFVRETGDGRGWEIVTDHVRPEPWSMAEGRPYYDRLAELCCPGHLARRAYSACEFLIREGLDLCRSAGARLIVLGIPDPKQLDPAESAWLSDRARRPETFDPARPDAELRAICDRAGVRFVTLRDHLARSDYKEHDCHWNARGHRRVAELLARLHRESGGASGSTATPGSAVASVSAAI